MPIAGADIAAVHPDLADLALGHVRPRTIDTLIAGGGLAAVRAIGRSGTLELGQEVWKFLGKSARDAAAMREIDGT